MAKLKHIQIQKQITEVAFNGDKQSLTEVFVILLDNAIKYSPEDKQVLIKSEIIDHLVIVQIIDQGIGIDKKDLPHIFDRFYRADTSRTKHTYTGYGLGLSIAKKIIEAHKGTISVTSEKITGTTFSIQIPKRS